MENSGAASWAWVMPSLVRTSRMFVPTLAATALPTFAASRDDGIVILPFKCFLPPRFVNLWSKVPYITESKSILIPFSYRQFGSNWTELAPTFWLFRRIKPLLATRPEKWFLKVLIYFWKEEITKQYITVIIVAQWSIKVNVFDNVILFILHTRD